MIRISVDPNPLAAHYTQFDVANRLLLTGHSHQAWPDVAADGQMEAFRLAAKHVDEKWAFVDEVRVELTDFLGEMLDDVVGPGSYAFSDSTHSLLVRMISGLDLRNRRRIVTSASEFHAARRQFDSLALAGFDVVKVDTYPLDTLTERMAAAIDDHTALALVSAVFYETAEVVPALSVLVDAALAHGAEPVIDAYHAVAVTDFSVDRLGLGEAWVLGGGYKYLQWGEAVGYLRVPPHSEIEPVITGWFAEFEDRTVAPVPGEVRYGPMWSRFAGGTFDPTSQFRARAVTRFFRDQGLTRRRLSETNRRQKLVLAQAIDAAAPDPSVVRLDESLDPSAVGGFLAVWSSDPTEVHRRLKGMNAFVDTRGDRVRVGPAPYLSDRQLVEFAEKLAEVSRQIGAERRS